MSETPSSPSPGSPSTSGFRAGARALVILFVASRVALFAWGLRFDASPVTYFIQIMDVELLRTDLVRTVLYAHSQPPLFNLAIGLALKIFPPGSAGFAAIFGGLYAALGLLQTLALYGLGVRLGARPVVAFAIAAVHSLLPTTLQYENWLLYSHPVACLVVLSVFLFERALADGRSRWTLLYFASLALIALTRLTFNWTWFGLSAALLVAGVPAARRRRTATVAAAAALIVLLPTARHFVLFRSLTTGDVFLGGSLSLKLNGALSQEQRADLISRGRISPLFDVGILETFDRIRAFSGDVPATGIPVLDQELKSTGASNFNNLHYRALSLRQFEEARRVMVDYPLVYLRTVIDGLYRSCARAGGDYGLPRPFGDQPDPRPSAVLLIALPSLLVFGLVRVRDRKRPAPERLTLALALLNIGLPTLVTCAISYGDFARYRFEIDGNYVLILILATSALLDRLRGGGSPPPAPRAV